MCSVKNSSFAELYCLINGQIVTVITAGGKVYRTVEKSDVNTVEEEERERKGGREGGREKEIEEDREKGREREIIM